VLEDLALLLQAPHALSELAQLVALSAGQALAATGVDVALAPPVPKRLLRDAQIGGDLLERNAGAQQLHRLAAELRRTRRTSSRHLNILPARASRPKHSDVHQTGSTPFTLPSLAGGRVSLPDLLARRRPLALVFMDPACGPTHLLPRIAEWQRTLVTAFR
jgi:hypothetical protein